MRGGVRRGERRQGGGGGGQRGERGEGAAVSSINKHTVQ